MKLAAKWHGSSSTFFSYPEEGRRVRVKLGGEPADVIRMGKGDPLVLVPGLAGGWKLLLPLARRLARDFEVILYGLRGDGQPSAGFSASSNRVWDMSGHANDLASLTDQLPLDLPVVSGV